MPSRMAGRFDALRSAQWKRVSDLQWTAVKTFRAAELAPLEGA